MIDPTPHKKMPRPEGPGHRVWGGIIADHIAPISLHRSFSDVGQMAYDNVQIAPPGGSLAPMFIALSDRLGCDLVATPDHCDASGPCHVWGRAAWCPCDT